MRETTDAELYLIKKYGSHRAHYEWRALEDAFNEGRAVGAATALAQQPAAVVELTGEELHEAWSGADGVPSGFDEYALRAVIAAHVAKQGGES